MPSLNSPVSLLLASLRRPGAASPCRSCARQTQTQLQAQAQTQEQRRAISQPWKQRQAGDAYAREARVKGLKSRAAFKLLEIDSKYRIFKRGQTVVDLGFAPGSWSQVAVDRIRPNGIVVGIDLIPAQPPRGVAAFQGNFLSADVHHMVKTFILQQHRQRAASAHHEDQDHEEPSSPAAETGEGEDEALQQQPSYIDMERHSSTTTEGRDTKDAPVDYSRMNLVDVVLSDMSAPWDQTTGFGSNTLSNPIHRLMNTSGNTFRDHAGSMDLCNAALQFASDTLRPGGHFVCKFYQGAEDKALERRLQTLFAKVHRDKPDASRKESKEGYFIGLKRKPGVVI